MLKKQPNEIFGAGDWLADELRRENRVSAWDMDGGRRLREEHRADCDARRLAAEHALDCDAKGNAFEHRREHLAEKSDPAFRRALNSVREPGPDEDIGQKIKKMAPFIILGLMVLAVFLPFLIPLAVIGGFAWLSGNRRNGR